MPIIYIVTIRLDESNEYTDSLWSTSDLRDQRFNSLKSNPEVNIRSIHRTSMLIDNPELSLDA